MNKTDKDKDLDRHYENFRQHVINYGLFQYQGKYYKWIGMTKIDNSNFIVDFMNIKDHHEVQLLLNEVKDKMEFIEDWSVIEQVYEQDG